MSSTAGDPIINGLQDAMRMENTSLEKLNMLLSEAKDPEMRKKLEHHIEETNEQIQRIQGRLQALGIQTTSEKAQAPPITFPGTLATTPEMKLRDDVKNGYAWENFEIAHYEFLKNQSKQAKDDDTKKVAEDNQKEEKDFAKEIEDMIPKMVERLP